MNDTIKNIILGILAVILFSLSLIALNNRKIVSYLTREQSKTAVAQAIDADVIQGNIETADATYDFSAVTSVDPLDVLLKSYDTSTYPVLGQVLVPSVDIHLTIYKGLANEHLLFGAGTSSATQTMGSGNYGLVSHRSLQDDLLFTPLDRVRGGDLVYVTDLTNIYEYTVDTNIIVEPNEVKYLDREFRENDGAIITLLTCSDIEGTKRRIVQGTLTGTYEMDEQPELLKQISNKKT